MPTKCLGVGSFFTYTTAWSSGETGESSTGPALIDPFRSLQPNCPFVLQAGIVARFDQCRSMSVIFSPFELRLSGFINKFFVSL